MLRSFFSFDEFLFPKIVKVIYWIGLVLIALSTIVGFFGALGVAPNLGARGMGGFAALFILIGGVIGIVVWRVVVELWIVLFSIHDVLREIRDNRS